MKKITPQGIAIGTLILLLFFLFYKVWEKDQVNKDIVKYYLSQDSILSKIRDEKGNLQVEVETKQATIEVLKSSNSQEVKDLKREVGNLKNLVSSIKVGVEFRDTGSTIIQERTIRTKDTTEIIPYFNWSDEWASINGEIKDKRVSLDYGIRADLELIQFWKRTKFLKPKELVTKVKTNNPHMDVSRFQAMVIKEPKKKWYETRGFAFAAGAVTGLVIPVIIDVSIRRR